MNSRTVCRICKTEGVRLHCITDTHLQEMYDRETHALPTTDDNKPKLACIECCDRLQHCYQLSNGIEQRKSTSTMMNLDPQLQISQNDIHQNNTCVTQSDVEKYVKIELEDLSDVEVKQESTSDMENGTLQDYDIKLEEDIQNSDSGDDSAPGIIKDESLNVNQNEANEITMKNEVNRAIKIENSEDISRKQNKFVETRNNAEETSCEKVTYSEYRLNQFALRNDVLEFKLEIKANAILKRRKTKLVNSTKKHFECDICKRCFNWKSHLIRHIRTHTGEKPFQCNVCKKSFGRKSHLDEHSSVHTGEKPYECDVCLKSFRQNSDLTKHVRIHTSKKPFKCKLCKKCFKQKSTLAKHVLTHNDKKPFECSVCKKGFYHKHFLSRHTRTHTGEKPFECDVCKKRYTQKSDLLRHTRIHFSKKSFQCNVCKKCFWDNKNLLNHACSHTAKKPIQCDICDVFFIPSANLAEQSHSHTFKKTVKCDACMKRYRYTYTRVTKHTHTHTGEVNVSHTVTN